MGFICLPFIVAGPHNAQYGPFSEHALKRDPSATSQVNISWILNELILCQHNGSFLHAYEPMASLWSLEEKLTLTTVLKRRKRKEKTEERKNWPEEGHMTGQVWTQLSACAKWLSFETIWLLRNAEWVCCSPHLGSCFTSVEPRIQNHAVKI